ncbi:mRNA cap guanine-N7 methyltransferase [Pararge aegeria]|uniref:mRNA cap guanine-N(7) methyltransferase n=3 Tax=Pararge aegeria TaxID=116150 RepID=A0A8S4R4T9_9NEOP|nr:mRNA cap guanine-N7 methyltransferase [Pararge aegeria]CAH2231748.1 jg7161 [Pararge aegeria aegeria]
MAENSQNSDAVFYKENTSNAHETKIRDDEEMPAKCSSSHANVVAAHYNHIEEKGLNERCNSPIFYLRNFNNWVKSVLIQEYTTKIREKDYHRALRVLDICCGKGGDLSKWQKARAEHVVFADIADVSIDQCRSRYDDLHRRSGRLFSAEFIAADCTKDVLRHKYKDPSVKFDLTSCQFGLHYSFESLAQARRMLANISECLKPDGYFFGTVPDAYEIVARCQKSGNGTFGNRIFNIKLLFDPENGFPLFGAKYDFHLEGVVNCPEFLVNFELFVKLAAEYGLELIYKAGFEDFYKKYADRYKFLLQRIKCFEVYPSVSGKELLGNESEYSHAKEFSENMTNNGNTNPLGTMSSCEWEVATIYLAFVFKKCKNTWDSNGKPLYITSNNQQTSSNK